MGVLLEKRASSGGKKTGEHHFVPDKKPKKKKRGLSYIQVIALVFILIIFVGTAVLMLPVSSKSGQHTELSGAFFTATSATCVTGLVVYDTFSHWTVVGQAAILVMIQVGGLGFMSVAVLFSLLLRRKIGLKERELMQEAINTLQVGGIVRLMRMVLIGTFLTELTGAILLSVRFIPEMGAASGIWNAIFYAVSAFCNAGFDLAGRTAAFSSLTAYAGDVYVNIVIMLLIIIGGIGFLVWEDVLRFGVRFSKYRLHAKLAIVTSAILIFVGFASYFVFEYDKTLAGMGIGQKILCALFQSVTFRTAGFATVDLAGMSPSMTGIACVLMLIGGSPGSAAGGLKTTTAAVAVLGAISVIRRKKSITAFGRRVEEELLKKVCAIAAVYLTVAVVAVSLLCAAENVSLQESAVEVFSAVGTVGLSMGLTPGIGVFSRILLSVLMYFGRVGGLSLVFALAGEENTAPIAYPVEKISVG